MMKKVNLKLVRKTDDSYEIVISKNISFAGEIKKLPLNNDFIILTDKNVYKLYADKIKNDFNAQGLNYKFIVVNPGEKSKSLRVLQKVQEKMIALGFDRKSSLIALGGGVVGDLGGFIAGTFMRGINFIQIPTTLLSMVDSSIGGKVAVDIKNGKNSSGLFFQPKKVFIDVDFLNTLPEIEFVSGMMEIIKHGIIKSSKYFNFIESNYLKIIKNETDVMIKLIGESCSIKAEVVEKDEKESGLRMILNFGHSIGHAIESASGYKLKHGIAVGIGMIKEAGIAYNTGILSEKDFNKIKKLIELFGIKEYHYKKEKVLTALRSDKKNYKNNNLELSVLLILPEKIGSVVIKKFSLNEVKTFI